ncbi:MAG TPA: hypothetical protein VGK59_01925 [Ohtaekwangia sp.]
MKVWRAIIVVLAGFCGAGCGLSNDQGLEIYSDYYDFNEGLDGWTVDFADYPSGDQDSASYELQFAHTSLPGNLSGRKGIMMSGYNYSDDLFMFMKKKVTGLPPNKLFTIVFQIELASNAPTGAIGVGGAPGESVYVKAGASTMEPKKVVEQDQYVLNIDKGNQLESGEDVITLGNIAVSPNTTEYELITRSNMNMNALFYAQTNSKGELWLIVGTDSGFEGLTTVYYTQLNFVFSATN